MRNAIWFLVIILGLVLAPLAQAAATLMVGAGGTVDVAVPASQYLNIFTQGTCKVLKQVGGPSAGMPVDYAAESPATVTASEYSYGPYTNATTVRIQPDNFNRVFYSVGALAAVVPVEFTAPRIVYTAPVPAAYTTTATLLATDLLNGVITGTHTAGATQAYTLPTGTLMDTASGLAIGQGFTWNLLNLNAAAADSITVTAGATHTIVGDPIVISNHVTTGGAITSHGCSSSTWLTKKTAANTFVTYRLN